MKASERRQLTRLNLRTPLRFRALGVISDKTEHFTEALNVSRGGFYFASSAPLQVGMPIEATLRMPAEVTGNSAQEMRCTARVVHVRNEPYGDGRIGFGAEIEKFQTVAPQDRWASCRKVVSPQFSVVSPNTNRKISWLVVVFCVRAGAQHSRFRECPCAS